ncbi:helix-turn-helix domain-containing protein, partial [Neglectibacter timonensis]
NRSCFPSYATLARRAGCSRRTAIRAVSGLEKLGLVIKQEQRSVKGDPTANLYVLTEQRTLEDRGTVFREPEVPAVPEKAAEPEEGQKEQSEINSLKSARESRRREEKMPSRPVPACHRSDDKKSPPPVLNCHHPSDKLAPELEELNKPQWNKSHSIPPSSALRRDRERERVKEKLEYGYFAENMPDKLPFLDKLIAVMLELRREDAPENRRVLEAVDSTVILDFLEEMKEKQRALMGVRNTSAWLKKVFLEFLWKREAALAALDP